MTGVRSDSERRILLWEVRLMPVLAAHGMSYTYGVAGEAAQMREQGIEAVVVVCFSLILPCAGMEERRKC